MKNAGVSASAVMELIGHDSEEVSRIYTHMEDATLRKAVNALPDIT
jgi:site-specific recombinase XerD